MTELTAADKINSAEECQKQEYYTALMKALEVSDIGSAYILLQCHFQKYSNMSDPWWEMPNSAGKSYKGLTIADMFKKHGHGNLFRMFVEYIEYKPLYENGTSVPLTIAVKACDVKSLNIFLDCVDLDEKVKIIMVNIAYTYFFWHKFNQIITKCKIITESEMSMVKRLLELGADVNGEPSVFPLCEATRAGSFALVELLCQHGADFNKTNVVFGLPPLSIAAADGRYDLVELMLKFGANSHDKTLRYSPADLAFVHDHTDCARLLVQHGANIDIENALSSIIHIKSMKRLNFLFEYFRCETHQCILENRHDLLMLAVSEANVEIVSHIFDIGFGITGEHPCLENLLAQSGDGEIAKFLIQKGADVNKIITTSCCSFTSLCMVVTKNMCLSSRLQVVQVLLENGASPNIHGDTSPLMLAALAVDSTDLLQLLLDHGADFNWRDTGGDTAFLYSLYQGCQCNVPCHVRCPIENENASSCVVQKCWHRNAEFLMRYAEDKDFLNAQNSDGLTALMQAVRYSNVTVVSEMIHQGSDVNMSDNNGNTALLYAIDRINNDVCNYMAHDIVACLVNAGCSINWQNNDGISPLMLATNRCSCKVMKLLLDAGADVNAVSKTDRSKTALSYFQPRRCFSEECVTACLSQFLLRGACLSYLQAEMFHRILLCNDLATINKYFTNGAGPISVRSDKYFNYFSHTDSIFDISPLCTALIGGNISLANHFIEMMFLTKSDLSSLMYNKVVRADLEGNNHRQCLDQQHCRYRHISSERKKKCLDLLDEMSSQPVSLFRQAFVTVSFAVGTSPGRENRVNMLPLPRMMKDKLLFKSPLDLTTPTTSSPLYFLPFDPYAIKYINLSDDCKPYVAWKLKKQHGIHCL